MKHYSSKVQTLHCYKFVIDTDHGDNILTASSISESIIHWLLTHPKHTDPDVCASEACTHTYITHTYIVHTYTRNRYGITLNTYS